MTDESKGKGNTTTVIVAAIIAILGGGSAPFWWKYVFPDTTPPPPPRVAAPPEGTELTGIGTKGTPPPVMGPLEMYTNRQGYDFDAYGKPAENAQLCAEMCRANTACKAMTYVVSLKTCWLKTDVPPTSSDKDMISAVRVSNGG